MSSKYWTGNSVVVPSQAAGVKIGVSQRMNPCALKKSRTCVDDLVPHPQDRRLALGTNPQVAAIQQVVDAVLLRRDRVLVRGSVDVDARHVDLVSAPGARVGPDGSGDRQRRLLREMIRARKRLVPDGGLRHHRLDESRAVADDQEVDLPARPAVVQPPVDGDLLALIPGDV